MSGFTRNYDNTYNNNYFPHLDTFKEFTNAPTTHKKHIEKPKTFAQNTYDEQLINKRAVWELCDERQTPSKQHRRHHDQHQAQVSNDTPTYSHRVKRQNSKLCDRNVANIANKETNQNLNHYRREYYCTTQTQPHTPKYPQHHQYCRVYNQEFQQNHATGPISSSSAKGRVPNGVSTKHFIPNAVPPSTHSDESNSNPVNSSSIPTQKSRPFPTPAERSSAAPRRKRPKCNTAAPTVSSTTATSSTPPPGYPKPLGRGKGFPLLYKGQYIKTQTEKFYIRPQPQPFVDATNSRYKKFRMYTVWNTVGDHLFNIEPSMNAATFRETKYMTDLKRKCNQLLFTHPNAFSARSSVYVTNAKGKPLLFLQKLNMVNHPKVILGYIQNKKDSYENDGAFGRRRRPKPDLFITREAQHGGAYMFRDRKGNEVACLEKYYPRSKKADLSSNHSKSSGDSKKGKKQKKHGLRLYVSAGYDCALFIMCATLTLDMWND